MLKLRQQLATIQRQVRFNKQQAHQRAQQQQHNAVTTNGVNGRRRNSLHIPSLEADRRC